MNLILLSGGSGKRLWPLSNDVRSKQFLKLLTDENGEKQSMVQLVYGQIKKAQPGASIVIATGASQANIIREQLPDEVEVVIEPERRDTFPAIALASAYLVLEKMVDKDEVVIVLPVDSYTDISYFQMFSLMEEEVKKGTADIVLMGLRPTFPSEKYGYIVPETKITKETEQSNKVEPANEVSRVIRFVEKPDHEKAIELISQGAVWNGGVFAFKLGFLMDILGRYVRFETYEDLHEKYGELEKISFDYKVVEKAKSAMILYSGEWKDIGTWRTLIDEVDSSMLGNVIADKNENTYVFNELDVPVMVIGMKNAVVVSTPEGILVSDLEASSGLKTYVDKLTNNRPAYTTEEKSNE